MRGLLIRHEQFKPVNERIHLNRLIDNVWYLKDTKTEHIYSFDWNSIVGKTEHKIWAKELIKFYSGTYSSEHGLLNCRYSTFKGFMQGLRRILVYRCFYDVPEHIADWGFKELRTLTRDVLCRRITLDGITDIENRDVKLASRGSIDSIFAVMSASKEAFEDGAISDCFSFHYRNRFHICEKLFGDLLTSRGIHITEYFRGGSFGEVRHEVVSLLVAECIKVLESDQTKLAIALCKFQRSDNALHHNLIYGPANLKKQETRVSLNKYIRSKFNFQRATKNHPDRQNARRRIALLHETLCDAVGYQVTEPIWLNHGEFSSYCLEVYEAVAFLFLALTGVRISELVSLRVSDFTIDKYGDWVFSSKVEKTHDGTRELRVMHGILAEAANSLAELSYTDKRRDNAGFFDRNLSQNYIDRAHPDNYTTCSDNSLRAYINRFYKKFQDTHGNQVAYVQPSISPHQLRHSFVGFSIRRFGGSIQEALRKYLLHSSHKEYTNHYTRGKLTETIINHYEEEYIEELIRRIATSGDKHEFSGKLVFQIKKRVNQLLKTHKVLTPKTLSDLVDEEAENVISIKVHSFGFCILTKQECKNARCINPKTNLPDPKQLSGFSVCSGCSNRLSEKTHKEVITRRALAHQDFLNKYPLKQHCNKAVKASRDAIKHAEIIINELGG